MADRKRAASSSPGAKRATTKRASKASGTAPVGRERKPRASKARKAAAEGKTPAAAATIRKAQSYRRVYEDWLDGMDWIGLAHKHRFSERRCQQIVEELRATSIELLPLADPMGPMKFAQDLILRHSRAISQYAVLAKTAERQQNYSVMLGALKQRDAQLERFTALMQELNWLPKHLGTLSFQMDAVQMAEVMLDVMDAKGVPHEVQAAIVEAIELRVTNKDGRMQLAAGGVAEFDAPGTAEEVPDGDREATAA